MGKKVSPDVQSFYDALDEPGKADLDRRMVEAGRTLADLRIARSTGKLDERLLVPKVIVPNKHTTGHERDPDPEDLEDLLGEKPAGHSAKRKPGEKLPEGKDLAGYIKDQMGDGRVLADFYMDLITMSAKEARKAGVYMNHKLMAAAWLGDRGWGKAKGDNDGEKGITINLVDYSGAPTVQPKAIEIETVKAGAKEILTIEGDAGKDNPASDVVLVTDLNETPDIAAPKEIEVEEFSIRD
jgi:hypothetical protein